MPYLSTVQVQSEFKIKNFGQNQVYGENLWLISLKTKIWCNNVVSRRFGKYSFITGIVKDKNPAKDADITPLHQAARRGLLDIYEYIADQVTDKNPV